MPQHIHGTFDVTVTPQPHVESVGDAMIGRMALSKRFHGALDATSAGEMLGFWSTTEKGSGGYVALERVSGSLTGMPGSFVLQHSSTMQAGAPHQSITVVPGSSTGELVGLSGSMSITIADGKHLYDFEFILPSAPIG